MVQASSSPEIIGSFRAILADPVLVSSLSESQPPNSTPIAAAMKGKTAKRPAFTHAICRSVAR